MIVASPDYWVGIIRRNVCATSPVRYVLGFLLLGPLPPLIIYLVTDRSNPLYEGPCN
jgi:hypothetical protein